VAAWAAWVSKAALLSISPNRRPPSGGLLFWRITQGFATESLARIRTESNEPCGIV
jgi:hypothetical protein